MSACSAVLLNKPQGLEKDQPWCAPLTPGCPVGLRSLPSLPTAFSPARLKERQLPSSELPRRERPTRLGLLSPGNSL